LRRIESCYDLHMLAKIQHMFNVVLGLAVVFGLLGSLFRPGLLPMAILIVVVLAWACRAILTQMFVSIMILRAKPDDADKIE